MSSAELPAPIAGDVTDVVIARLQQAELLIAQAEPELARDIRDQAEAAALMARRRKVYRLEAAAGRLRLLAESRLGELCPVLARPTKFGVTPEEVTAANHGNCSIEAIEPDKNLRHQYRRVHDARDFLDRYLEECRIDEETPTRAGFLEYAEAALRAVIGHRPSDEEERPKKKREPEAPLAPAPRGIGGKGVAPPLQKLEGADWKPAWPRGVPMNPPPIDPAQLQARQLQHPVLPRLALGLLSAESWARQVMAAIPPGSWEARYLAGLDKPLRAVADLIREACKHGLEVQNGGKSRIGG